MKLVGSGEAGTPASGSPASEPDGDFIGLASGHGSTAICLCALLSLGDPSDGIDGIAIDFDDEAEELECRAVVLAFELRVNDVDGLGRARGAARWPAGTPSPGPSRGRYGNPDCWAQQA